MRRRRQQPREFLDAGARGDIIRQDKGQEVTNLRLFLNPRVGMSGDMMVGALVDLGATSSKIKSAMETVGQFLGDARVRIYPRRKMDTQATKVDVFFEPSPHGVDREKVRKALREAVKSLWLKEPFAQFAQESLEILFDAEEEAHREIPALTNLSHLHEATDILMDIFGTTVALEELGFSPKKNIYCLEPVYVGGGKVSFSHGTFPVPAPATERILDRYKIPYQKGPLEVELLTPTGATLLTGMVRHFLARERKDELVVRKRGYGAGTMDLDVPNVLEVIVAQ